MTSQLGTFQGNDWPGIGAELLGPLVFGDRRQLADDFLKAGPPLFIRPGCHGRGILLAGVTVIQVSKAGDLASQGHNVSQNIGGIHSH